MKTTGINTFETLYILHNKENNEFEALPLDQNFFKKRTNYSKRFSNSDIKELEYNSCEITDTKILTNEFKRFTNRITLLIYNNQSFRQITEQDYYKTIAEFLEKAVNDQEEELDYIKKIYKEYLNGTHYYTDYENEIKITEEKIKTISHFTEQFRKRKIKFNVKCLNT